MSVFTHAIATNNYGPAKFIVDASAANGTHTTIASALAVASSGDTIFIRPGTYTENLTLVAGVNLTAYDCDALTPNVIIVGKCTATFSGTCTLSGILLRTNSDACISITGSNTTKVNLVSCYIHATNATAISINNTNATLTIQYSLTHIAATGIALFACTNVTEINFYYVYAIVDALSSTASTIASGQFRSWYSSFRNPVTSSGTADVVTRHSHIICFSQNATALTHNGTGSQSSVRQTELSSGTASTVSVGAGATLDIIGGSIHSGNTNVVTGSGTVNFNEPQFLNSSGVNISTEVYRSSGPRIQLGGDGTAQLLCGSGSPSGSVTAPKGSLYLRTDGSSSSTRAYVNTNSGTSWTAITTAS